MHTRTKLLMAALTAALVLSIGAGAAAALRSISIVGETTVTLNSRRLTFEASVSIICEVTLIKILSRVIPKRFPILIGGVREIHFSNCAGSSGVRDLFGIIFLRLNTSEDWRMFATGFLGTLPSITGLATKMERLHLLFALETLLGDVNCLYSGDVEGLTAIAANGQVNHLETTGVETLAADNTNRLNSQACPVALHLKATGAEGQLNDRTLYSIRLI